MMTDKEAVRSAWRRTFTQNRVASQWGRAAEKLRGLHHYRNAATVFATPAESLHQARINCLVDGKNLVMPAPSIRTGFFLLPARTIPYKELSAAVTYKGLEKHGQLLKTTALPELSVALLLTDSLAIDLAGGRLGDGNGFFDLCCALLHETGGLHQDWTALSIIREEQISRDLLPQEAWDIKMSGAITPTGIHTFDPPLQKPQIFWDALSQDRIKRIDPLHKLQKERALGAGCRANK